MNVLDTFKLKDKVAVITGGGGYLGEQFAQSLGELGAHVVLADIHEKTGQPLAKKLSRQTKRNILFKLTDVSNPDSVNDLVEFTDRKFKKIDILINGAIGVGKNHFGPFEKTSLEDWKHVMNVTTSGTFLCCQKFGEIMKKKKSGNIINMASIYGVVAADQRIYGDSGINSPAVYAASKGAIISFTRYLAAYWAPYNIRVNAISPGGVYRNQDPFFVKNYSARTPLQRMLNKEELKPVIAFLASDASSYVTGHNLLVDGGWSIW